MSDRTAGQFGMADSSDLGMLMTPSPALQQSPAPTAAPQSVSSSSSTTAPQLSPTTQEPSPLSFMKSFAEASAAAGMEPTTKGNSNDFNNWSEFSGQPAVTPVTTAAPLSMENLPIPTPSSAASASASTPAVPAVMESEIPLANTEDWAPSAEPFVISQAALRSACTPGPDGRIPLKEFLSSITTLEKFSRQLNSLPATANRPAAPPKTEGVKMK